MFEPKDYISPSIWTDLPYPNFIAWLNAREAFAEKPAILFRECKKKEFTLWNYQYFVDRSRQIARGILAAGLQKGDRVVLWAENRPEWMAVWMGAVISGCVIVPIDFLISNEECLNIIKLTEAKAGFFSARKADFADSLSSSGVDMNVSVMISGEDFCRFGADSSTQKLPAPEDIQEDDPCSIVFTSGTSGFAKGVTLKHKGIIANASAA